VDPWRSEEPRTSLLDPLHHGIQATAWTLNTAGRWRYHQLFAINGGHPSLAGMIRECVLASLGLYHVVNIGRTDGRPLVVMQVTVKKTTVHCTALDLHSSSSSSLAAKRRLITQYRYVVGRRLLCNLVNVQTKSCIACKDFLNVYTNMAAARTWFSHSAP